MPTNDIHAAQPGLPDQAVAVEAAAEPVKRPVCLSDAKAGQRRVLGVLAGELVIPADFDAPLPDDIIEAFEGG